MINKSKDIKDNKENIGKCLKGEANMNKKTNKL